MRTLFILGIVFCCNSIQSIHAQGWVQIGQDIEGASLGDSEGHSTAISANGDVIATGSTHYDNQLGNGGRVRIYDKSGNSWIQRGGDLEGNIPNERFGHSIDLSDDGNTVIIGATQNAGPADTAIQTGAAYVYNWSGSAWVQQGAILYGDQQEERFGITVSISSTTDVVAVGTPVSDLDSAGCSCGLVRIFSWNGVDWIQKGTDIIGNHSDGLGGSVELDSTGSSIVIGSPFSDSLFPQAGHTVVYSWSGIDWVQKGQLLLGDQPLGLSGYNVAMSYDGNTIAYGAVGDSGPSWEIDWGQVKVFTWNGTSWIQKGQDLYGEAPLDRAGTSVSLSGDGSIVVVGMPHNNGDSSFNIGAAIVYKWNTVEWVRLGNDIEGDANGNMLGYYQEISKDGSMVICGSIAFSNSRGKAQVFKFSDVGIPNYFNDLNLSIYPIPFKSVCRIKLSEIQPSITCTIFNLAGKRVYSESFLNCSVVECIPQIESGLYILELELANGSSLSRRIVKE